MAALRNKAGVLVLLTVTTGLVGVVHSEVAMERLEAGARSGITAARQVVIRSEPEWQLLWGEHAPQRPMPKVDFANRMVVGIFLGTRPTSGFGVQIVAIRQDGDALLVEYVEHWPSPSAMVMQVLTSPFYLASTPAAPGDVRFQAVPVSPRKIR